MESPVEIWTLGSTTPRCVLVQPFVWNELNMLWCCQKDIHWWTVERAPHLDLSAHYDYFNQQSGLKSSVSFNYMKGREQPSNHKLEVSWSPVIFSLTIKKLQMPNELDKLLQSEPRGEFLRDEKMCCAWHPSCMNKHICIHPALCLLSFGGRVGEFLPQTTYTMITWNYFGFTRGLKVLAVQLIPSYFTQSALFTIIMCWATGILYVKTTVCNDVPAVKHVSEHILVHS